MSTPSSPLSGTFSLDPMSLDLEPSPLDQAQIVDGSPEVSERVFWESDDGSRARGVWQITPGVSTDVEVDEMFVVLTGRATIEVDGGPTIEVGPGSVCVLEPGARTTWRVHETLRKVFDVTLQPAND